MFKAKNNRFKKVTSIKSKVDDTKPINKKTISNKKTEFHRSLEAFSDCV